jgi:hypothetical protein
MDQTSHALTPPLIKRPPLSLCLVATHINRGIPEASPTISHGSQHVDLISILKGATDNSDVSPINNAVKQWENYGDVQSHGSLDHGSMDISHQDLRDVHHLQWFSPVQTGFQFQHQRQQQQQQPLLQHLMSLPSENLSGGMSLEQLFPSGLSQDPLALNLIKTATTSTITFSASCHVLRLNSKISSEWNKGLLEVTNHH